MSLAKRYKRKKEGSGTKCIIHHVEVPLPCVSSLLKHQSIILLASAQWKVFFIYKCGYAIVIWGYCVIKCRLTIMLQQRSTTPCTWLIENNCMGGWHFILSAKFANAAWWWRQIGVHRAKRAPYINIYLSCHIQFGVISAQILKGTGCRLHSTSPALG